MDTRTAEAEGAAFAKCAVVLNKEKKQTLGAPV